MTLTEQFVATIKGLRPGRTVAEIAAALGISRPTLNKMFAGKYSPTLEQVERATRRLGLKAYLKREE